MVGRLCIPYGNRSRSSQPRNLYEGACTLVCKHKGALWADDICSGAAAPRSWCCLRRTSGKKDRLRTRYEAPTVTVSLRYKRVFLVGCECSGHRVLARLWLVCKNSSTRSLRDRPWDEDQRTWPPLTHRTGRSHLCGLVPLARPLFRGRVLVHFTETV